MSRVTPGLRILSAVILGLAACTGPTPRCDIPETRELRKIDDLIAQSQATLDRGYVLEPRQRSGINLCLGSYQTNIGVSFCTDPGARSKPVAIDEAAERRKLASLTARRDDLEQIIAAKTAACGKTNA